MFLFVLEAKLQIYGGFRTVFLETKRTTKIQKDKDHPHYNSSLKFKSPAIKSSLILLNGGISFEADELSLGANIFGAYPFLNKNAFFNHAISFGLQVDLLYRFTPKCSIGFTAGGESNRLSSKQYHFYSNDYQNTGVFTVQNPSASYFNSYILGGKLRYRFHKNIMFITQIQKTFPIQKKLITNVTVTEEIKSTNTNTAEVNPLSLNENKSIDITQSYSQWRILLGLDFYKEIT